MAFVSVVSASLGEKKKTTTAETKTSRSENQTPTPRATNVVLERS